MKLSERIRDLLGPSGDGEKPEPEPAPRIVEVVREPEPAEALAIAQGQELLGPCRECDGYWTREVVRGQKPLDCPVCKRDGPPA